MTTAPASAPPQRRLVPDLMMMTASFGLTTLATAPFERLQLLLQCRREIPHFAASDSKPTPLLVGGIRSTIRRVGLEQGVASWWRGGVMSICSAVPARLFHPLLKDGYTRMFGIDPKYGYVKSFVGHIAAGAASGITSMAITYPFDVGRVRMAIDVGTSDAKVQQRLGVPPKQWANGMIAVGHLRDRVGWFLPGGVYTGSGAYITGMIAYQALSIGLYDFGVATYGLPTQQQLAASGGADPNWWTRFGIAFGAGVSAGVATYPLSTITNRMIATAGALPLKYPDLMSAARTIYRTEGVRGFYGGGLTNVGFRISSAIALVAGDRIRGWYYGRS